MGVMLLLVPKVPVYFVFLFILLLTVPIREASKEEPYQEIGIEESTVMVSWLQKTL